LTSLSKLSRPEVGMHPEAESYLTMLDDLRGQVRDLITGLPPEALNWQPIAGSEEHATNSLAILATHIAGAEHYWIGEVVGRLPASRDRDAEFASQATRDNELIRRLEGAERETRQVLSALGAADLAEVREARGRPVPVRWCILHVIDHTALHLGHMQLTYQLWAGGRSRPSPRWFERLEGRE
jgi:uncharacterized damage-inducible protein DinB